METIKDKYTEEQADAILDMLTLLAHKNFLRMDAIVRRHASPEDLALWQKTGEGYEEVFRRYEDCLLEEDTLLDIK